MDKSQNNEPILSEEMFKEAKNLVQVLSEIIREREEQKNGAEICGGINTTRELLDHYKKMSEDIAKSTQACARAIEKFENNNPGDSISNDETRKLIESFQQVRATLDDADDMYRRLAFALKLVLANAMMSDIAGKKQTYSELLNKSLI